MTLHRIALVMTLIMAVAIITVILAATLVELDFTTPLHGSIEPARIFPVVVAQPGYVTEIASQGAMTAGATLLKLDDVALSGEWQTVTGAIHALEQEIEREAPPVGNPRRRFDLRQQCAARQREALRLQAQLRRTHVAAPFSGMVVASHAHTGDWLTVGDAPAAILIDQTAWRFEARVSAEVIRDIQIGAPARVRVAAYPYRTYGDIAATVQGIELTELPSGAAGYDVSLRIEDATHVPLMMGQRATALVIGFHGTPFQYFTRDEATP